MQEKKGISGVRLNKTFVSLKTYSELNHLSNTNGYDDKGEFIAMLAYFYKGMKKKGITKEEEDAREQSSEDKMDSLGKSNVINEEDVK